MTCGSRFLALSAARQQRQRELSLLSFEREELDQAKLEPNEIPELTQERDRLLNAQHLQAFAAQGYSSLYDEETSVADRLGHLHREAETWAKLDPQLMAIVERLAGLRSEVQDVAQTLRSLGELWEADPARLEEVEHRLQLIRRLEAKYRKTADELILYRLELDEQESKLKT